MNSADLNLFRELQQKREQLQSFRASLSQTLQATLDHHEWSVVTRGGHRGLPLITLRLPSRVFLGDPFLISLAEQVEEAWGPVDFALFSGEASEPVRVLSQTILDERWRWRG